MTYRLSGVYTVQAAWPVVWFGLGLIMFARIMRVSAAMRADLEGTV